MRMTRLVLAALPALPALATGALLLAVPARAADEKSLDALAGPPSSRFT